MRFRAVVWPPAAGAVLRDLHRSARGARAGLHVGPVILTENTPEDVARGAKPLEVDGIAKPTAARLMSVASGGQTLLTEGAALGEPAPAPRAPTWRSLATRRPGRRGALVPSAPDL